MLEEGQQMLGMNILHTSPAHCAAISLNQMCRAEIFTRCVCTQRKWDTICLSCVLTPNTISYTCFFTRSSSHNHIHLVSLCLPLIIFLWLSHSLTLMPSCPFSLAYNCSFFLSLSPPLSPPLPSPPDGDC